MCRQSDSRGIRANTARGTRGRRAAPSVRFLCRGTLAPRMSGGGRTRCERRPVRSRTQPTDAPFRLALHHEMKRHLRGEAVLPEDGDHVGLTELVVVTDVVASVLDLAGLFAKTSSNPELQRRTTGFQLGLHSFPG